VLKSSTQKLKRANGSKPSEREPHQYQKVGVQWLLEKPRSGLFWDPGLGKTITVLLALKILRGRQMMRRTLVLSKKKIVTMTWPEEIAGWFIPLTYAVAAGSADKRRAAFESDADIVLMNNENVAWAAHDKHIKGIIAREFDVLVVDESSKYRSTKTGRWKALKKLLKYFKRRYILTGTPAPKGLLNLFGQVYIMDRGESLGQWITQFRNKHFVPHGYEGMKWVPRSDEAANEIYDAIAETVLRTSNKILKLPKIVPVNRVIKLDPKARAAYDEMEREFILEWDQRVVTAFNAGVKTQKLRQLANGAIYYVDEDGGSRETLEVHDAKVQDLVDLYEESQGVPLLVNYEFDHDRVRIQRAFAEHEDALDVPAIYGGTSDDEALRLKDLWNKGELPILLSQGETASHGLNMQKTRAHVVFFGVPWDLEVYIQFIDRVRRQGYVGGETVMVYHLLVEDSVDWVALRGAELKDKEQNALFVALEERYGSRSKGRGSVANVRPDWAWQPDEVTQKAIKSGDAKLKRVADNRKLETIPQEAIVKKLLKKAATKEKRAATVAAKKKQRELNRPEQIIPLKITVGQKRAMEILCETIEAQGRKPPRLRLKEADPVNDFVLAIYEEISQWPTKHLGEFIRLTTGEVPTELDDPSMLGESKRIFHEMFGHEEPSEANLKDPASVWKMWPHVRSNRNQAEEDDIMQTQTQETTTSRRSKFGGKQSAAPAKQAAAPKKKAAAVEKAPKKSAPAKVTKKKASKSEVDRTPFQFNPKDAEKAGVANLARIKLDEATRIAFVKDPTEGGVFQELAEGAKAKSVKTVGGLIAKMKSAEWDEKKVRGYTAKLIRRGCIRVVS
jgi:hypothetical protein